MGKASSSTQSNPDNSTTINDSKKVVDGGSIYADSGASISVTNTTSDAETVAAATEAMARVSESASENGARALSDMALTLENGVKASSSAAAAAAAAATQAAADSAAEVSRTAQAANLQMGQLSSDALASNEAIARASNQAMAQTAGDALSMGERTASAAIKGVESAAYEGQATARQALTLMKGVNADSLGFAGLALTDSLSFAKSIQEGANETIRNNNTEYASNLARNSGDAAQTVAQDALKTVTYLGAGLAAIFALTFLFKKN